MSLLSIVISILAGILLIAYAARDVFHTVFHPVGSGAIGTRLGRWIWTSWRPLARWKHALISIPGPLSVVAVIWCWAVFLAVGFALIYLPFLPASYVFQTGLDPSQQGGFLNALYLSAEILVTLGLGDIAATPTWLRLIAPFEALMGLGVFTASISWVLATYPALNRRRSLAQEINYLKQTAETDGLAVFDADPLYAGGVLYGLVTRIVTVESDFVQFPITYYFHPVHGPDELANVVGYLDTVSKSAMNAGDYVRRHAGTVLNRAVADMADTLRVKFLNLPYDAQPTDVWQAYARDHMIQAHDGAKRKSG